MSAEHPIIYQVILTCRLLSIILLLFVICKVGYCTVHEIVTYRVGMAEGSMYIVTFRRVRRKHTRTYGGYARDAGAYFGVLHPHMAICRARPSFGSLSSSQHFVFRCLLNTPGLISVLGLHRRTPVQKTDQTHSTCSHLGDDKKSILLMACLVRR